MKNVKMHNDWISDLHDSLLIHILSLLKTKQAVQTCVLSKRWRNLWTYIPCRYFDFADFFSDDVDYDDIKEYDMKFERFVTAVLQKQDTPVLDSFKLVYDNRDGESNAITEWILCALNWKPRILDIYVDRYLMIDLPDLLFDCKSLEKMTLQFEGFVYYKPFKTINLPSLKKLELSNWKIDDYLINILMSGCPVLEDLTLSGCTVVTHIISSNKLKHLFIDDFYFRERITISIPSLSSLVIHSEKGRISLMNMSSLVMARVMFFSYFTFPNPVHDILKGLSDVTNLEIILSGGIAKAILKHELSNCATFKNLKSLHVDGYMIEDFHLIALILQHTPNLEKLTLRHREPHPLPDVKPRTSKNFPMKITIKRKHLQLVEIIYEANHERVYQLVKILHIYLKSIGKIYMHLEIP
ncbi:F-box family protein [Rhynchospora pubera]|uniref:F-box family protein n=1 Tax=Rhynchospora pubera TaxID=906938 RepID=A0AAV8F8P0_9POAL|nr:F-box family protein [Rhynchospora pubera]